MIDSAKELLEENLIDFYEARAENKECFILNPTEITRNQKKYYYPFNLVLKTRSQNHLFFRRILEEMAKILEENPFPDKNLVIFSSLLLKIDFLY